MFINVFPKIVLLIR